MVELLRSNNPVLLSWAVTFLGDSGITAVVMDGQMSILEGSIGALPRRLMVHRDDAARARELLKEAEIDYDDSGQ